MNGPDDDDYEVGYKKPPKHSRWKKGESGNSRKKAQLKIPNIADMIDEELAKRVSITEKGVTRKVTILEVILLRLFPKLADGNKRAIRIHRKYQAYAQGRPTPISSPMDDPDAAAERYRKLLEDDEKRPRTKEELELSEAFRQLTLVEAAAVYRDMLQKDYDE